MIARKLARLRNRRGSERILLGVAILIFLTSLILSYRNLPSVVLDWRWLLLTAGATAVVLLVNGLEYKVAGRMLGHPIGLGEAFRVGILSSAANLLPIPGAVLVRTQALKMKGSGYGEAFKSTGAIGAGWLGIALTLAGLLLALSGNLLVGLAFLMAGIGALVAMVILVRLAGGSATSSCLQIIAVETVFVLLSGVRVYASLHGIGVNASATQALALTVAAALANAAGVFPGGLGLRELIAGALSPLVGLPIAAGVFGAAIDRLVGLIVLAVTTLVVIVAAKGGNEARSRGEA
jgi:uncharacterized membrane protein YbhN (UPF0104 family)